MDTEVFRAASYVVEHWLGEIADARCFADQNDMLVARGLVLGLAEHDAPIEEFQDALAAASDGVIRYNGPAGPQCFVSAHEAAVTIRKLLLLLVDGNGLADALLMVDTELLKARVRRERAKLVESPPDQIVEPDDTERDWISVSDAVSRLPFINDLRALYRFAEKHPEKLKLRKHPEHGRRRQAYAADVLALEKAHDTGVFDALDDETFSKAIEKIADRQANVRQSKQK